MKELGKILVIGGVLLLIIGLIIWLGGDKLKSARSLIKWFGHLPGDISIHKPNFSFYFPIVSMILMSIILSALIWIIQKFLK